ncbi:hypothetical protein TruAng_011422 [Truncatella angustata]|nr:hypothetical protein TruAng_011422 [Truncatella angustata]
MVSRYQSRSIEEIVGFNQKRIRFKPVNQSSGQARKLRPQNRPAHCKPMVAKLALDTKSIENGSIVNRVARNSEEAGIRYYPDEVFRSLPDWAVNGFPPGFSACHRSALLSYLDVMPKRTYVFEYFGTMTHNPLRDSTMYKDLVLNPRLLRGAVVIGGVCEAIRCRNTDPVIMAYLSAELCSWVNPILSEIFIDTCRRTVVVQAIATLALLCHLRGQYDQWHIHVKGLNDLVEYIGGIGAVPPCSRGLIYKANIIPATELAIEPYVRVYRFYPRILDLVDTETRNETYLAIERTLGPCCGDKTTLEIFRSAALFLRAVFPPWTTLKAVDPDALMEEWWSLAYDVLTMTGPIWPRQNTENKTLSDLILDYASSDVKVTEERSYEHIIGSTLRLSLVLFSKLITPYLVDTPEDHPLLLLLHKQYIRAILLENQHYEDRGLVDPISLAHTARASFTSHRAMIRTMRPALIWCTLLGSIFTELCQGLWGELMRSQSVYQDIVVEMIGPSPADVDDLPESDLEFCQRFDLKVALGQNWGPKAALKRRAAEEPFRCFRSSAIPIDEHGRVPKEMSEGDICECIADIVAAAKNAIAAGFDGVEIHAANAYLIDQFTQDNLVAAVGSDRVGIRLSPWNTFQAMRMKDPVPQFSHLVKELKHYKLAYMHIVQSQANNTTNVGKAEDIECMLRIWDNRSPVLVAGGFCLDSAIEAIDHEYEQYDIAAVVGRYFISTPDLGLPSTEALGSQSQ